MKTGDLKKEIAEKFGCNEKTVGRAISRAEKDGLVEKQRREKQHFIILK